MDASPARLKVHERVAKAVNGAKGTVKFHGHVANSPDSGEYVGVVWDDADAGGGRYDGEIYGVRYFSAPEKSASFLKPTRLDTAEPLCDVLLQRYQVADQHTQNLIKSVENGETAPPKSRINVHAQKTLQQNEAGAFPFLKNVSAVGLKVAGCAQMGTYFPGLVDLNLSCTLLSSWGDVAELLASLPTLNNLSLAGTRLEPFGGDQRTSFAAKLSGNPSGLSVLSLAATRIPFDDVAALMEFIPGLTDLNLSENGYTDGEVHFTEAFPSLISLRLQQNNLTRWGPLETGLSNATSLEALYLSQNRLDEIEVANPDAFGALKRVYLRESGVSDWASVEALAGYGIEDLSLVNTPLTDAFTSHERRCLLVARIPTLTVLNRGAISNAERENCERFAVRSFAGRPIEEIPKAIRALRAKHGDLQPLGDIDLAPKLVVSVTVDYSGLKESQNSQDSKEKQKEEAEVSKPTPDTVEVELNVRDTITQISRALCKPLGLSPSDVTLTHIDPAVKGTPHERQTLVAGERMLYTFRVRDGDTIAVCRREVLPDAPLPPVGSDMEKKEE